MIIWMIIGVIMQAIGNIFKRSDILFLGYYLAGTGKTRSLPEYTLEAVIEMLAGIEMEQGEECILNPKNYTAECNTSLTDVDVFNMLHDTVGKFKAIYEHGKDYICIKDLYIFYPCCVQSGTHFHDCNCPDDQKAYLSMGKEIHIPKFIYKITDWVHYKSGCYYKYIKLSDTIELKLGTDNLSFSIEDKFWVNKGKPFEVYTEIPV